MSISGLTNSALDSLLAAAQSTQNGQGGLQQIEAEFQQLGQDLQTGNLTEAQEDYTTAGNWPGPPASPSRPGGGQQDNQVSQALDALSTALQSGNLAGAQSAFATLTQTLQLGAGGNSGSINVKFVFVAKQRKQRERLGLNFDHAAQKSRFKNKKPRLDFHRTGASFCLKPFDLSDGTGQNPSGFESRTRSSRDRWRVVPATEAGRTPVSFRKEVIQPQVLLRLPCYDFTPIMSHTLSACLLAVGSAISSTAHFRDVTGGVYKARERIHGAVLMRHY